MLKRDAYPDAQRPAQRATHVRDAELMKLSGKDIDTRRADRGTICLASRTTVGIADIMSTIPGT